MGSAGRAYTDGEGGAGVALKGGGTSATLIKTASSVLELVVLSLSNI